MDLFRVLLSSIFIYALSSSPSVARSHRHLLSDEFYNDDVFNVFDYGASGDGYTDDSQAFLDAWNDACESSINSPRVYVPEYGIFLLNPIIFQGPCKPSTIHFVVSGAIMAPESPSTWDGEDASLWIEFNKVNNLLMYGFGVIHGQGQAWWDQSCKYQPHLALKFTSCNESSVSNLNIINSAQTHVLVRGCEGFNIQNLAIDSPHDTPNTDGIHIQSSSRVFITNTVVGCGDDCISVGDYNSNIDISNVRCGPGHGISIGSLGKSGNYVQVEKIRLRDAYFNGTTNGARIKTWQVGRGFLRDVKFQNLRFNNVKNPIIIDQHYCYPINSCKERKTGVRISNVAYREASGTSSSEVAINLNCSRSAPCRGTSMQSIHLAYTDHNERVVAQCNNAYGEEVDVFPGHCLLHKK